MNERSEMISWIRGEMVGPTRPLGETTVIQFNKEEFTDLVAKRKGPVMWKPSPDEEPQEVLYYDRESPHRKYGAGLLHPAPTVAGAKTPLLDEVPLTAATDRLGAEVDSDEPSTSDETEDATATSDAPTDSDTTDPTDDFEVTSPDVRHPSTIGISICVRLSSDGRVIVRLPQRHRFSWQPAESPAFPVNGRYESGTRRWTQEDGHARDGPVWRRLSAVLSGTAVAFSQSDLVSGRAIRREVTMPVGSPVRLRVEAFPRRMEGEENLWLITLVLRNSTQPVGTRAPRDSILYQTFFDVIAERGCIEKYPESQRPFEQLDHEEQSLALLYRESATWGIGHGCAAGWDAEPEQTPQTIFADVMPAVELPSMTPDIVDADGNKIQLSMRALASLSEDGAGPAWQSLENLATEYSAWIQRGRDRAGSLDPRFSPVAMRHFLSCTACLERINKGISLLRSDSQVRRAFRLSNLSMLLQQIATKQLTRRPLDWDSSLRVVAPQGIAQSPWDIYGAGSESSNLGHWRAFQIAFLLMSLEGASKGASADRNVVDLIWFPTGGGKTEAYLAVMAFYMFHERFLMAANDGELRRDGTNVLMRYTLRMLTTQQFQRAASLICAMDFLRRDPKRHGLGDIPGARFSLGLWIGGAGSPNDIRGARSEISQFRNGDVEGNPLVLTECPWCRGEIGRYRGVIPRAFKKRGEENSLRIRGIADDPSEGPRLHCPDANCTFGREFEYLPVEVIDERIYNFPPSLVIATADKLAMIAYRPKAGALFGRSFAGGQPQQVSSPPGLIIQDELHLISGPLGTMYALYEGLFERLCSYRPKGDGAWIKPKLIASTATIRGASDQVMSLYARPMTQLFPAPGLMMGDSFFGRYARDSMGRLSNGRLYLGIHASEYGSVLTTQVRAFSSALFRPYSFADNCRDAWWTLLAFYNSIRELGGAKTLFDSDIRSRLKFMFNREGFSHDARRNLKIVEELTSRLSQAEIVRMMDRLSASYAAVESDKTLDACLASNIIEVGVDIDRLSLMGVVGQPKTTATYIQVTGRVGRKWWERAGLIMMIYNPSKSRDRSHFEQFHSYHRRLYERVEPTSATPFAVSAIQRALPGALIAWARQHSNAPVQEPTAYENAMESGYQLLRERCLAVQAAEDQARSLEELDRVREQLENKWSLNPQYWGDKFPPSVDEEYLMLWPGQFATRTQKDRGLVVPTSMRQVDGSAELTINQGYATVPTVPAVTPATPPATP
ncbi:MAG TPA: helicase-related protein [Lacunisphaera sp.]|jgi:hypothetical protein